MSELMLPEGWVEAHFTDCIEVLDSQRKPINNTERQNRILGKTESELYPYYGATGQVGWIDDYLFDEELVALGEDGVPFFDISKHKAYMLKGKTWVNNHAHVLKAIDGVSLNKYLLHFFNNVDYLGYVNGGTRLKLTQTNMKKIPIILPSLNEQKEIVRLIDNYLTTVSQIQARLDAIPKLIKKFRQSVLNDAVSGKLTKKLSNNYGENGWRLVELKTIMEDGMQNGLYKPNSYYGRGVKIVRIDSFYDGKVVEWDKIKRVELENDEKQKWKLRLNDILINRVNSIEYLGKCARVADLPEEAVFESNIMRFSPDTTKVNPKYLIVYLTSIRGINELRKNAKLAVNQASINQQDVGSVICPLPSLNEQAEIVKQVNQLFAHADQIEKNVAAAKARVDNLTQSILHQAFTGKLTEEWRKQNPELITGDNSSEALLAKIKAEKKESKAKKKK